MQVDLTAIHGCTMTEQGFSILLPCIKAVKKNTLITSKCADMAFISPGFSNWKDTKVAF